MAGTDIRKILECEILKQKDVVLKKEIVVVHGKPFEVVVDRTWDFDDEIKIGLFVKTIRGFKHILTDTIYPEPSDKTANRYVVNPRSAEQFVVKERVLATHLINRYGYSIGNDVVECIEQRLNNENSTADERV